MKCISLNAHHIKLLKGYRMPVLFLINGRCFRALSFFKVFVIYYLAQAEWRRTDDTYFLKQKLCVLLKYFEKQEPNYTVLCAFKFWIEYV